MNKDNLEDIYALSPVQQGMLFHTLLSPERRAYFHQQSYAISGNLQPGALLSAWQKVIARHTALRTAFIWERREKPLQVVSRQVPLPWRELDWRHLEQARQQQQFESLLEEDRERGFDLSTAPLMRLLLIRVADEKYHFVWSYHHVVLDGWSVALLINEVFSFYKALCHGRSLELEEPRPFRDYITWLRQQDLTRAETFWRETLKGFSASTPFGVDHQAGSEPELEETFKQRQLRMSAETTAGLQRLARQRQLTLNTILQGAWGLLLSRYSGEPSVLFGSVVSGRPAELADGKAMVGLFINTLPVRINVEPEAMLLEWLKRLQTEQVEARQYEYSPLVQVHGWSEVPRGQPFFESLLIFESFPKEGRQRELDVDIEIRPTHSFERTHYPLTVVAWPGSELLLESYYDSRRFDTATIDRMLGHLQLLLESFTAAPEQRLKHVSLLTAAERQQLLIEWNETKTPYPTLSLTHHLFELQAARSPLSPALCFDHLPLSYHQLNHRANQLAHFLLHLHLGPEHRVALLLDRSPEMVIALLAILKAGAAFIPLDPLAPPALLAFYLSDTRPHSIITQEKFLHSLPPDSQLSTLCCIDRDRHLLNSFSTENPTVDISADNLSYIIYTSGSTGTPKGAMNTHRGLLNRLLWMQDCYALTSADRVLQKTPYTFDVSVWEFFWPLIIGARLILARPEGHRDSSYLVELIEREEVTVLHFVPSMLQQFLEEEGVGERCRSVRQVISSGEALTGQLAARFRRRMGARLDNLYGPTEASIDVTFWESKEEEEEEAGGGSVPIGRAIANTQIYILDREMEAVPVGVSGELYIGGEGVGRGYWERAEMTAERFVPHPFSEVGGERLYRTGDVARYRSDGVIEYVGRLDHQVKVRGLRIELGEIEAVVSEQEGVKEAVVVVREEKAGDKRLVAYVVGDEAKSLDASQVRRRLKERLPEYMVPQAFVLLDEMPLTANGKLDRRALPPPDQSRPQMEMEFIAPRSEIERTIAAIWQEVLRVEKVSVNDNFFDLGGHSLLMFQVHSKLQATSARDISMIEMFQFPTIGSLARHLSHKQSVTPILEQSKQRAATRRELRQRRRQVG